MAKYIDTSKVEIPKDFFDNLNVPKLLDWLNTQPAADVAEVKRGAWAIVETNKIEKTIIVECSECGAIFNIPMFTFGLNYNYCPNCGAKMEV